MEAPYNYTIPSDNRELQQGIRWRKYAAIIPYQVITGNYNEASASIHALNIIPYQVITGNYNVAIIKHRRMKIIPYQVIMRKIRKVY